MIVSYTNLFSDSSKRTRVKAKITSNHSASSYGQPVIVLKNGEAIDLMSWVGCNYQVVRASKQEKEQLQRMGLL